MTRPTPKHYRMEVEWADSTILHEGWEKISDILNNREAVICTSVGFILADDAQGIVLAASVHGAEAAGVTMIPRKAVVSRRRLT